MSSTSDRLQSEALSWVHFLISAAPSLLVCICLLGCLLNITAGVIHSAARTLLGYRPLLEPAEKEMV